MIGIYKITNLINGKSYIGQSINIKRRWQEHKNMYGTNPIYKDMQKYGLENFFFETIEECSEKDLDKREIYWIKYYNTFNNGYNRTLGGQTINIKNQFIREILDKEQKYKDVKSTHWQVYYYLQLKKIYDKERESSHYFVYKKDLNISQMAKELNISRPTIYTALKRLNKVKLITEEEMVYNICEIEYCNINKELLNSFLIFSKICSKNIDLLRTFLILKKLDIITTCPEEKIFTRRNLILLLGHNVGTPEHYNDMTTYIALLKYWGLIEIKS